MGFSCEWDGDLPDYTWEVTKSENLFSFGTVKDCELHCLIPLGTKCWLFEVANCNVIQDETYIYDDDDFEEGEELPDFFIRKENKEIGYNLNYTGDEPHWLRSDDCLISIWGGNWGYIDDIDEQYQFDDVKLFCEKLRNMGACQPFGGVDLFMQNRWDESECDDYDVWEGLQKEWNQIRVNHGLDPHEIEGDDDE